MDSNSNSSVYDTGLPGSNRPIPKPRCRVIPPDERPQVKPVPPPRPPPRPDKISVQQSSASDSIDNLPLYRKNIEELIKEGKPQKEKFQAACSVMKVQCSLNSKYESIELWELLEKNKGQDVRKIPQAFSILEKYATNLLKDEANRHPSWNIFQMQSAAYQSKVKFMIGALDILKSMGYTEENFNNYGDVTGLAFPTGTSPNSKLVLNIAVDLIIAQFEVEAMIMGEHPRENELRTIEDVPKVYFQSRNLSQYIAADIAYHEAKPPDYVLTKTSVSSIPADQDYDVPPPIPPKNSVRMSESHINQFPVSVKDVLDESGLLVSGSTTPQITCLKCNTKLTASSKFCSECGSSLKFSVSENDVKTAETSLADDVFTSVDEGWSCEHCTYVNSHDKNVCEVCYRTSSTRRNQMKPNPISNATAPPPTPTATAPPPTPISHTNDLPTSIELDHTKFQEAKKQREDALLKKMHQEQQDSAKKKKLIIEEQNAMREDGRRLVTLMKLAENHGYSVEECLLAQSIHGDMNGQQLLDWLKNDWVKLIDDVVDLCNANFANDMAVGVISKEEAKLLLLNMKGNNKEIVKSYAEQRKVLINNLADLEKLLDRPSILKALVDAGGDCKKARMVLQKGLLHTFCQNLRKTRTADQYDKLKDESIPKEVKQRMVMGEIGVSWGRAEFVFRLLRKQVSGTAAEILQVIRENNQYDYEQCIKFFSHECCICYEDNFSFNNIYISHYCDCKICLGCFREYLKVNITGNHIRHLSCPSCGKPDLDDPDVDSQSYFSTLLLPKIKVFINKNELDPKIEEIFQEKLLDFHLKKKDNFRYCNKCKNGFEWDAPNQKRMVCNRCQALMCYECRADWEDQHDGLSCEDFQAWKEANDPATQERGVVQLLNNCGIQCPECKFKYELAKGGCMHFTCLECKFEFCSGCNQALKRKGQCAVDKSCEAKGLHSHCPRDCLSFLRDFEMEALEKLLTNHQLQWSKEYPQEMKDLQEKVCGIDLQKEKGDDLVDEACGDPAPENMSGLCPKHYKEFLVMLINNNGIDPVEVMDSDSLNAVLHRHFKPRLEINDDESDDQFKERLIQTITTQLPLPRRKENRRVPPAEPQLQDLNELGAAAAL